MPNKISGGRLLLLAPELPRDLPYRRLTIPRFRTSRNGSTLPHRWLFYPISTLSHLACLHPIPLSPGASFPNRCPLSQRRPTSSVWTARSSHRGEGGRGRGGTEGLHPQMPSLGRPSEGWGNYGPFGHQLSSAAVEPLTPVQPAPPVLGKL